MSDKCGNCDCADRSQCTKKGDSYSVVMPDTGSQPLARPEVEEVVTGAEHDGCKCGTSCSCTNCTCGK
ncbi:unnamed protein product [Urochloa decumbens]|uniref:Uncharacterized protein n=1 Tax=Urochloa decumbens TaxID=240449 RepID=A0ABC8ZUH3_9POAL